MRKKSREHDPPRHRSLGCEPLQSMAVMTAMMMLPLFLENDEFGVDCVDCVDCDDDDVVVDVLVGVH